MLTDLQSLVYWAKRPTPRKAPYVHQASPSESLRIQKQEDLKLGRDSRTPAPRVTVTV